MEVRAGDTATYGDNVSENLHMTSKNEVKNNKFNFLNKQHLCNILFFFFSFFVWITCKCFCFRHPCFLSYKYTCNACNNLSFEMMEVTSTVWQNLPTKKSFLMGAFFKNFSNSNISCYALQVGDRGYPRDWGGEKKKRKLPLSASVTLQKWCDDYIVTQVVTWQQKKTRRKKNENKNKNKCQMRDIPKFILGNNVNDIPASTKNSCASGEVYKLCPIAVGAPLRNCMLTAVPT